MCPACIRDGVLIDAERVRILDEISVSSFTNNAAHGLWTSTFECDVRVVNQTSRCVGAPLVIFRTLQSAASRDLRAAPDSWHRSGYVHFTVSNGTLVPSKSLALSSGSSLTTTGGAGSSSSASSHLELMPVSVPSRTPSQDGSDDVSSLDESSFVKRARCNYGATSQHEPAARSAISIVHRTANDDGGQEGGGQQHGGSSAAVSTAVSTAVVQQPPPASLLSLASSHAQLTTHLQHTLALAASESDDPHVAEYLACLRRVMEPVTDASSLLQRAVDSRQTPRGLPPPSAASFPPSPPVTSSTVRGGGMGSMTGGRSQGAGSVADEGSWMHVAFVDVADQGNSRGDPGGSPADGGGVWLEAQDYYVCDRHAIYAVCCWPILIAQLLQRATRTKGTCGLVSLVICTVCCIGVLWVLLSFMTMYEASRHVATDLPSIHHDLSQKIVGGVGDVNAHPMLIPSVMTTGVSDLETFSYPRAFDESFRALVPSTLDGELDWDDLRTNPQPCKRLLQDALIAQAGRVLGVVEALGANETNAARGLLPFCGMMAYQVSQLEYTYLWGYCVAMDYLHLYLLASLNASFLLLVLFEMIRRREGILPKGRCAMLDDLMYILCCCPCAASWMMRTEKGAQFGHSRRWSLLSPVGAHDETEVLPVHT